MMQQLIALARLTLRDPRIAAAALLEVRLTRGELLQLAVVVASLSVLFSALVAFLASGEADPLGHLMLRNPLLFAVIQFMTMMLTVIMVQMVGRMMGGRGSFDQSLILIAWLQFYMLLVQVIIVPLTLLVPGLALVLNLAAYIYFLWVLVNFIAGLHGFRSLMKVLAGVLATSFGLSLVLMMILLTLGVNVEGV